MSLKIFSKWFNPPFLANARYSFFFSSFTTPPQPSRDQLPRFSSYFYPLFPYVSPTRPNFFPLVVLETKQKKNVHRDPRMHRELKQRHTIAAS